MTDLSIANQTNLTAALECAVPLWIAHFREQADWETLEVVMRESQETLRECAEALFFRADVKTAKAFNATARAIAVLSFCPGGIEIFGRKWESYRGREW